MKNCLTIFLTILILLTNELTSQENKKQTSANRTPTAPLIDGLLNDAAWEGLPALTDFVQYTPYNGDPSKQKTKAFVCYDDNALYVGAIMYDTAPDSIMKELGPRDSQGQTDTEFFTVHLNPHNDGINSVYFSVSACGVQTDFTLSPQGTNNNWDAVWDSEVSINDSGWIAEIRIPYSALRIPEKSLQDWGFNMFRRINRHDEWSSWSYVSNELDQWWVHIGEMKGFENISPPLRLSITPYLSTYAEKNTKGNWGYSYNAGADLKYGISESFTLDLTLVPDFGHVQSDDEELNLSPYEIHYDERRQFFTEGSELFNKANLFYSRRIGQKPVGFSDVEDQLKANEKITDNPVETQLINATKLSGRTTGGLGVGLLNAMTANTYATVRNTVAGNEREIRTQHFTNYNVSVLDQTFANNSFISLVNTNVWRNNYLANVTGTEFRFMDEANAYSLEGTAAFSQVHDDNDSEYGEKLSVRAGKVAGEFQYNYRMSLITDTYDQNDLGYLRRNNELNNSLRFQYSIFKPFGIFLRMNNSINVQYQRLFKPSVFTSLRIHYEFFSRFKNNYTFSMHASLSPIAERDYYETRTDNRYVKLFKYFHNCFHLRTDRTQPFYVAAGGGFTSSYDYKFDSNNWSVYFEPSYRFSDKFNLGLEFWRIEYKDQPGYVDKDSDLDKIYFGKRHRIEYANYINVNYLFNNKLSLCLRLRHYWSEAVYNSFYELDNKGELQPSTYNEDEDINYNAFTIDANLKWYFAPGSELLLVWKNSIFNENKDIRLNYWNNFDKTISSPQTNSLIVKLLYYVDSTTLPF